MIVLYTTPLPIPTIVQWRLVGDWVIEADDSATYYSSPYSHYTLETSDDEVRGSKI